MARSRPRHAGPPRCSTLKSRSSDRQHRALLPCKSALRSRAPWAGRVIDDWLTSPPSPEGNSCSLSLSVSTDRWKPEVTEKSFFFFLEKPSRADDA